MQVEYLRKASGTMTATARVDGPLDHGDARELPVRVEVTGASGVLVARATIAMWVSPRPTR